MEHNQKLIDDGGKCTCDDCLDEDVINSFSSLSKDEKLELFKRTHSKVDEICKLCEVSEDNTKVTISKDDFNFLTYGVLELSVILQNKVVEEE